MLGPGSKKGALLSMAVAFRGSQCLPRFWDLCRLVWGRVGLSSAELSMGRAGIQLCPL